MKSNSMKKFLNILLFMIIGLFVLLFGYSYLTGKPLERAKGPVIPGWSETMGDQSFRIGK